MPGTTILNGRGDVTIAWDAEDDPKILALIEAKMAEGFVFFLIEERLGGAAAPLKTPLQNAHDALRKRVIAMALADGDRAVAGLIESGDVRPVATPDKPARTTRKAKTAPEVAAGESVAVRPARGG